MLKNLIILFQIWTLNFYQCSFDFIHRSVVIHTQNRAFVVGLPANITLLLYA